MFYLRKNLYQTTKHGSVTRCSFVSYYTILYAYNLYYSVCVLIRLGSEIGSGQFGMVSHGIWNHDEQADQVAIKTLRGEVSEEAKKTLMKEAAIIGQFVHTNIVKLYGVVTKGDPVSLDTLYIHKCL